MSSCSNFFNAKRKAADVDDALVDEPPKRQSLMSDKEKTMVMIVFSFLPISSVPGRYYGMKCHVSDCIGGLGDLLRDETEEKDRFRGRAVFFKTELELCNATCHCYEGNFQP